MAARKVLHDLVCELVGNRFFSVEFIKRTNGERRKMVCRKVSGDGLSYDPADRGLLCVKDVGLRQYRMVNLDGLISLKVDGQVFEVSK